MTRFLTWLRTPHPTMDRLWLVVCAFVVGVHAGTGHLNTRSADDAFWLFLAVILALLVVCDLGLIATAAMFKVAQWKERRSDLNGRRP